MAACLAEMRVVIMAALRVLLKVVIMAVAMAFRLVE